MSRVCVKITELRREYGPNATLKSWMSDPDNVYCGRAGRVSIARFNASGSPKTREIFGYAKSEFANPFSLKEYSLEDSLLHYRLYIVRRIALGLDLEKLRGKNLGCWCLPGHKCHVDILLDLLGPSEDSDQ